MTTTPDTSTLSRDQRARYEEAQVQADEANARKAAADAAMSELTLTQARYKALVPDLTGVATNAVTDKSAGVAFSGLVTHSALNHAAKVIANQIADKLPVPDQGCQPVILVTSQTDLLTSDLLFTTVDTCLHQLLDFANDVLARTELQQPTSDGKRPLSGPADLLNALGIPLILRSRRHRRRRRADRRDCGRPGTRRAGRRRGRRDSLDHLPVLLDHHGQGPHRRHHRPDHDHLGPGRGGGQTQTQRLQARARGFPARARRIAYPQGLPAARGQARPADLHAGADAGDRERVGARGQGRSGAVPGARAARRIRNRDPREGRGNRPSADSRPRDRAGR